MPSYDLVLHKTRSGEEPAMTDGLQEPSEEALLNTELENHYRTAQESWAEAAQRAEDFVHGIQYTAEQIKKLEERGQAPVVMNVIMPAVEQAVAMLTTNHPRFQATAREDSDVKTASVISDLMSWIWEVSHGNQRLKAAIWDYYVKGRGVLHVYIDPTKDFGSPEICFYDEDPLEVYPDPNSRDPLWSDAAHIIISKVMTREQIEAVWPQAAPVMHRASTGTEYGPLNTRYVATEGQQVKGDFREGYHEKYRVITRYTRVKVNYVRVSEMFSQEELIFLPEEFEQYLKQPAAIVSTSSGQTSIVTGEEYAQVEQMWQEGQETDDPRVRMVMIPGGVDEATGQEIPPEQLQIMLVTHADLLEMQQIEAFSYPEDRIKQVMTIGGELMYEGMLPIAFYPVIPLMDRHNRTPYPNSDVQAVVPVQEQINKMQSLITANMASSTNVKALVPRGSVDKDQMEQDFAKAGAAILEYDAEMGAPVIAQPVPISNGAFTQMANLIGMVERQMGIYGLMQGDASQAPATHKGTIAIEQFGQRRIKSKQDNIEASLNQMGRVVASLIPYVYTERKVIRLKEPNNSVRESVMNQLQYDSMGDVYRRAMDVTSGFYDIIIVTGSTLPSNRYAMLEFYMGLYQMGLIDQVEVLKKTDLVDIEGVLERHSMMSALQQQVSQLSEEVKSLQGDLQTREREVYHAKMALAVEKGESEISRVITEAKGEKEVGVQRIANELAMLKREAALERKSRQVATN